MSAARRDALLGHRASRLVAIFLASWVLVRAAPLEAQRLRVRVVDVVGDRAYLEPGAARGVRRGGRVRFGARSYEVVATTDSYAVIDITGRPVELGARGLTRRGRSREERSARLPAPTQPPSKLVRMPMNS